MLIKKAYIETPGIPKILFEKVLSFWLTLKINPISVINFVRSIKGNRPGRTENTNSFSPEIVLDVYLFGFDIIKKIIINIKVVKSVSINVEEVKIFLKFLELLNFLFVVIISYMLKLVC